MREIGYLIGGLEDVLPAKRGRARSNRQVGFQRVVQSRFAPRSDRCGGHVSQHAIVEYGTKLLDRVSRAPIAVRHHDNGVIELYHLADSALPGDWGRIERNQSAD
jgi:hypothetical protein